MKDMSLDSLIRSLNKKRFVKIVKIKLVKTAFNFAQNW